MEIGTFLWIISVCTVVGTGALVLGLWPLFMEVRATIATAHSLMQRVDPDVIGLTHDAKRIMGDAVILTDSLVKQKQSVDTAIATVGFAVGNGYGQARHWLAGALGGARRKVAGLLGGGGERK